VDAQNLIDAPDVADVQNVTDKGAEERGAGTAKEVPAA
jgi:hypothetical protein